VLQRFIDFKLFIDYNRLND